MKLRREMGLLVCAAGLAGCIEDTGGPILTGSESEFASMEFPCISQAARLTGVPSNQIVVTSEIQTGGGPLLVLDARGTSYSCRLESDGSVTVFSEFAN